MSQGVRATALGVAVGAATVLPGFLVGALSLQIRDALHASLGAVAAGVTVFFSAGALSAGPLGRVSERVGPLTSMRASAIVTAVSLLAIAAFAGSLGVLFALLAVAGLANGANQPAINLYMAEEVHTERQGLAFGIKQSAIPAAITLSGLALPVLALPLGWRATTAVCGGLVLVVAAVTANRSRGVAGARAAAAGARAAAAEASQAGGGAGSPVAGTATAAGPPPRLTKPLFLLAVGAALAAFGPSALSAGLVATAVHAGVSEGPAGLALAVGSAASLVMRVALGARADRRADYGFTVVAVLLAFGAGGFALLASGGKAPILIGAFLAFTLGWGWPGLYNLAVVQRYRSAPAAATGITQSGIYVGAATGPVAFGLLVAGVGYSYAWLAIAGVALLAAMAIALAQSRFETSDLGTNQSRAGAGIRL
jgi:MFS family permease